MTGYSDDTAYTEGYEAANTGAGNPYDPGTAAYASFEKGRKKGDADGMAGKYNHDSPWQEGFTDNLFTDSDSDDGGSSRRPFAPSSTYNVGPGSTSSKGYTCYQTHPPMPIPGTDFVIYGGSCGNPVVKDADVYIGFDAYSMKSTARRFPWKKGTEFDFPIKDMQAPADVIEFNKMVKWTAQQLKLGAKVHCGCIGGHGRTGTFLAALVKTMAPETENPIQYVRDNYCKKTVETEAQVMFLVDNYGAKKTDWRKGKGATGGSTLVQHSGGQNPRTYGPKTFRHASGNSIWGK